jgi:hypothetical protein
MLHLRRLRERLLSLASYLIDPFGTARARSRAAGDEATCAEEQSDPGPPARDG